MHKWRAGKLKASEDTQHPVKVVSDAAIASAGLVDGRFIPVLILDTTGRPDIDELVKFHEYSPSGDVRCTWGSNKALKWKKVPADLSKIALFLEFERPCETFVNIEFDVLKHAAVIDTILESKGLYIQPGKEGDRFMHDPDRSKIFVEVPDTGFREQWSKLWHKSLVKKFKKTGLNRPDAIKAADETIKETRKMHSYRMGCH